VSPGSTFLPAPIPELLKRLKHDPQTILRHGHAEIILARAPGRLDVMGGLSDYAGALACDLPLDVATAVAFQRRDDRKLVIKNYLPSTPTDSPTQETVEISLDDFYGTAALLPENTLRDFFKGQSHWAASVAGAYPILARHKKITRRTPGANIAIYSNIPGGAGLASASATACAALAALTAAYHLILDPLETALLAMKVEHHVVGSSVGISAAAAAVLGKKDQLHLLHCQPHESKGHLAVPPGLSILGISIGPSENSAVSASRRARTSAFIAQAILARMYKDLGFKKDPTGGYLANVAPELYPTYFRPILPDAIEGKAFLEKYGAINDRTSVVDPAQRYTPRASADYHVLESARSRNFVEHLRAIAAPNDNAFREVQAAAAGNLMLESHHSAIANGGPQSDRIDALVQLIADGRNEFGIYGARATGGTVTLLARTSADLNNSLAQICGLYRKKTGDLAQILDGSSNGSAHAEPLKIPLAEL
jgi:galactokinase